MFDDIKRAVAHNTLLSYLGFNRNFDINMDARNFQIGEMIIQDVKPINLYILKVTGTKKKKHSNRKIIA